MISVITSCPKITVKFSGERRIKGQWRNEKLGEIWILCEQEMSVHKNYNYQEIFPHSLHDAVLTTKVQKTFDLIVLFYVITDEFPGDGL